MDTQSKEVEGREGVIDKKLMLTTATLLIFKISNSSKGEEEK